MRKSVWGQRNPTTLGTTKRPRGWSREKGGKMRGKELREAIVGAEGVGSKSPLDVFYFNGITQTAVLTINRRNHGKFIIHSPCQRLPKAQCYICYLPSCQSTFQTHFLSSQNTHHLHGGPESVKISPGQRTAVSLTGMDKASPRPAEHLVQGHSLVGKSSPLRVSLFVIDAFP